LSSVIAADALGGDRVHMIMLPSHVTSRESIDDATECAKRIGARLDTISIEPGMRAFHEMLSPIADDNLYIREANNQTRIRGSLLMAISAQEKALLLTTGNKSELATGFMQLYGDMCGQYCVLKDIYKTTEYQLAAWRNAQSEVIPHYAMTRAPSGETVPGQKDQDILPPYELLDEILYRMVEQQYSLEDVISQGFERGVVQSVAGMLFHAEYKRRQSAPGVKISSMSFGRDRRYPITSIWRGTEKLPEASE
jgi:NAD+ synthase